MFKDYTEKRWQSWHWIIQGNESKSSIAKGNRTRRTSDLRWGV